MIEPLPDNNWLVEGDVLGPGDVDPDWQPEYDDNDDDTLEDDVPLEIAKTKLIQEDERVIDGIISGIHPQAPAKSVGQVAVGRILGESEHPAETPFEARSRHIAEAIVVQYLAEKARLEHFKQQPDLSRLRRNVWIAVIRNYQEISEADRHYIEQAAGLNEHNGNPVPPPLEDQSVPQRERDFRERQYRDD